MIVKNVYITLLSRDGQTLVVRKYEDYEITIFNKHYHFNLDDDKPHVTGLFERITFQDSTVRVVYRERIG